MLGLREWIFTPKKNKPSYNSAESGRVRKKFKIFLKTIYKKVFLNTTPMHGFLHCVCPPGMSFWVREGEKKSR